MRWNEPVVSKTSPELPVVAFPVTIVTWPESPESAVLLEAISMSPVLLEVPVAAPESSSMLPPSSVAHPPSRHTAPPRADPSLVSPAVSEMAPATPPAAAPVPTVSPPVLPFEVWPEARVILPVVLESSADFRLICPAVPSVDGPERIEIDPPSPSVPPNADPATSSKSPPESPSDESDALPDRRMT